MIIWWVFNQCGAVLNQWKVFLKCANLNFNFEWNEGFDKGWLKNSYLSDVTFVLGDLKFIGKFFQRSTTFMLMISSNSRVLEVELRFEVWKFCFKFFLILFKFTVHSVSGSRHWACRLQPKCWLLPEIDILCKQWEVSGPFADFSTVCWNLGANSKVGKWNADFSSNYEQY